MTADDTFQLTDALIAELQTMDTPTVCNALELLVPKRRGAAAPQTPALHASSVTSPWWVWHVLRAFELHIRVI